MFLTSEEGEEKKCIGCHIFTGKKYSDSVGFNYPYTILIDFSLSRQVLKTYYL